MLFRSLLSLFYRKKHFVDEENAKVIIPQKIDIEVSLELRIRRIRTSILILKTFTVFSTNEPLYISSSFVCFYTFTFKQFLLCVD